MSSDDESDVAPVGVPDHTKSGPQKRGPASLLVDVDDPGLECNVDTESDDDLPLTPSPRGRSGRPAPSPKVAEDADDVKDEAEVSLLLLCTGQDRS
jgi:hypothetical protein